MAIATWDKFDPARGGRHAPPGMTDLVEPSGAGGGLGNDVEPYTYGQPEMSQTGGKGGLAPGLAPIGASAALAGVGAGVTAAGSRRSDGGSAAGGYENYYNPNNNPRSAPSESQATSAGFAGRGAGGNYYDEAAAGASAFPIAHPTGSSGPTSPTNTATTAASRKAREAQQERLRAQNANDVPESTSSRVAGAGAGAANGFSTPASPTSDGAPPTSGPESVVLHSDGGRYVENPDEDENVSQTPEELPPQYHSIPADRR